MSVLLRGLDGSNPLGFLAAVGALRVLTDGLAKAGVLMKWIPREGAWIPELVTQPDDMDPQTVLDALWSRLSGKSATYPPRILSSLAADGDGDCRRKLFEKLSSRARGQGRLLADWLAALGSDAVSAEATSQLQTARRDYYRDNLRSVIDRTEPDHLRRAIFDRWDYADMLDNQSLHLDPSEDRRHAYQWHQPSGDPNRERSGGMLGANRLAIEAIPVFTSFPEKATLRTVGFTGNRSTNTRWTWPLWDVAISLAPIRSLLLIRELQEQSISPRQAAHLRAMGIVAIKRTDRILVGKTPNFTPTRDLV